MSEIGRGSSGPMSGTPTAVCDNTNNGLPPCGKGQGKYCYWLGVCASQMRLSDPTVRTRAAEYLYQGEFMKALEHAHEEIKKDDLIDRKLDPTVNALINTLEDEKDDHRRRR